MSQQPASSSDASSRNQLIAWLILAFLALVWGSSFILIKKSLEHGFSPTELGASRLIMAGLFLFPFFWRYLKRLTRTEMIAIAMVGLVGTGIPATLFPLAQTVISSTTSGMLNSLAPLFTLVLGALFFGFTFDKAKLIGVIIGMAGAFILIFARSSDGGIGGDADFTDQILYALIAVVATLGYGISTNIMKRYLNNTHPVVVTALAIYFVTIPYAIYLFGFTDMPAKIFSGDPEILEGLFYVTLLGALGTGLALLLFNRLVQLTDAVVSSSVTYLIPIVALVWGVWDNEAIGWAHIVGMLVILAGVWLVNSKKKKPLKD
ncbi:MAG: DMT family transporter [Bacteroidia bacterium]